MGTDSCFLETTAPFHTNQRAAQAGGDQAGKKLNVLPEGKLAVHILC